MTKEEPSLPKSSDLALIWEQFKKGDQKAFSALFERTSDRLYRYGTKFVTDTESVKDNIQDLFVKLYENRKDLPTLENPLFYLFKSLKNMLIDEIRKNEQIVRISLEEAPFHVNFIYNEQADDETDEEIKEKFEHVVNLLSDRQKEAIYLRFQSEMSYEEIAELLRINYQSARNLIHRAIEKIRREMDLKIFIPLFISIIQ